MYQCDSIEHGYTVQFIVHTVGLVCVKLTDCLLHNYDGLYQCGSVGHGHTVQFSVHTVGLACAKPRNHPPPSGHKTQTYRIFSIKRPWHLFQTWPDGPGVHLKPAFNRGLAFINKVFFLLPWQADLLSPNLQEPAKLVQSGRFFLRSVWQTFPGSSPSHTPYHTIQYAYYCTLQSRCVKKKSINNTCSILRQGNTKF